MSHPMINRLTDEYLAARDALIAAIVRRERLMVAYRDAPHDEQRAALFTAFLHAQDWEAKCKRECDRLMPDYHLAHGNRQARRYGGEWV